MLSLQSCKSKGLNWPFFRFSGAFSDFNTGFPQWCGLAETLHIDRELKKTMTATAMGTSRNKSFNEQNNSCARVL